MKFYSTNNHNLTADAREAVTKGLAPDNGLYMPEEIPALSADFFNRLPKMSFQEMALAVAQNLLSGSIPPAELERIVSHTLAFDAPLTEVEEDIYALELFHGPTMAFKDFGARFMSQLLGYFAKQQEREIIILVATSGDTGSAVANGFLGVKGTRVVVLYPSGKVSDIQEKQFTTLGSNITALEVDGTFDDCQRLVKTAFLDEELKNKYFLTSANSINIARLIPQSFYFFYAFSRLQQRNKPVVFCVPSGNFGNITGGLLAQRMGLPISHFVAATNINDVVPEFLRTHKLTTRPSQMTISNAMDVGSPSNVVRMLDLFGGDVSALQKHVSGYAFTDDETRAAMRHVFATAGYVMDPHGAVGYLGMKKYMREVQSDVTGVFLETAHPAKFKEVVEETLGREIEIPSTLQKFLSRNKQSKKMSSAFSDFKTYLTTEF
ncbi:threonine synthase [Chryseolinea sp. T2]|uniref:threonine synthase n=1 Tax=Chryseolinea sp. T2 TaxID=3129255 RepID=UPI0030769257